MINFITELKSRNEHLFWFGLICFLIAIFCLVISTVSKIKVLNTNSWFKPFKFAISIGVYSFTMGWYCFYLPQFNLQLFNWVVISLLGFELLYILIQASRGQLSHFNVTSPFYGFMFTLMGIAITVVVLYTAYVGLLFFGLSDAILHKYYLWSLKLGILIFVIFSFEGFLMGAKLSHSVGDEGGDNNVPILNWSKKYGDLRIAHFIGMHALQVLPLLAFYVLKNTYLVFLFSIFYFILALYSLRKALRGKPFFKSK